MFHCSEVDVEMHNPDILRKAGDITVSGRQGKLGLSLFLFSYYPSLKYIHTQTHNLMPTVSHYLDFQSLLEMW